MSRGSWFLPDTPDVVGVLRRQVALTVEGMDAFADWAAAGGDAEASAIVHAPRARGRHGQAELREALRSAFVTPLDPEDLFALSRGIDWILNHAKDAIGESEVMALPAGRGDGGDGRAARRVACAEIDAGVALDRGAIGRRRRAAPTAAVKAERRLEKAYRAAMGALVEVEDLRAVMGRRELYRRCSRMGEAAVDVAERLIYAELKES